MPAESTETPANELLRIHREWLTKVFAAIAPADMPHLVQRIHPGGHRFEVHLRGQLVGDFWWTDEGGRLRITARIPMPSPEAGAS